MSNPPEGSAGGTTPEASADRAAAQGPQTSATFEALKAFLDRVFGRPLPLLCIISLAALTLRVVMRPSFFMDLDSYAYLRMARDFLDAITSFKLFSQPFNRDHYFAVEYFPALYPFMEALFSMPTGTLERQIPLVSLLFGGLLPIPVYFLARAMWGVKAALLAALLVAVDPVLVKCSAVPRTESLYIFLYASAVCMTWLSLERARPGSLIIAGALWGLAYLSRFEGIAGVIIALIVISIMGKGRRRTALLLAGFLIVSSPYLFFLGRLAHGPAVLPPAKAVYDLLEGAYVTSNGPLSFGAFQDRFGTHGAETVEELLENARRMELKIPWQAMAAKLPEAGMKLYENYSPLLLLFIALAIWEYRRDRKVIFILAFCLPIVIYSIAAFWDIRQRYYSFTIPLAICLASPQVIAFLRGDALILKKRFTTPLVIILLIILSLRSTRQDFAFPYELMLPLPIEFFESKIILEWIFYALALSFVLHLAIKRRPSIALASSAIGVILLLVPSYLDPSNNIVYLMINRKLIMSRECHAHILSYKFLPLQWSLVLVLCAALSIQRAVTLYRQAEGLSFHRGMAALVLPWLVLASMQSIIISRYGANVQCAMSVYPRTIAFLKEKKPPSVMSGSPWDAWLSRSEWVKLPLADEGRSFMRKVREKGVRYVVIDRSAPSGGRLEYGPLIDMMVLRGVMRCVLVERSFGLEERILEVYEVLPPSGNPGAEIHRRI